MAVGRRRGSRTRTVMFFPVSGGWLLLMARVRSRLATWIRRFAVSPTSPSTSKMEYIGIFTDDAINRAIERAGKDLAPGKTRVIAHADLDGEIYVSAVKKLGSHVSVEAAWMLDASEGFKFDRQHMKGQIEIIGEF